MLIDAVDGVRCDGEEKAESTRPKADMNIDEGFQGREKYGPIYTLATSAPS